MRRVLARHPRYVTVAMLLLAALASCEGSGGNGASGDLAASLSSPAAPTTHTNGTLTVQVAVTGSAEVVELHRDGALLVTLEAPYTYAWDTTAEPEGSYELTAVARRGTASESSEARTVVVDRTAPTVTARTPAPDAQHVWVGNPITVTFSEAVAERTLSGTSVTLAVAGGADLDAELITNDGGEGLTVVPVALPEVPVQLELALDASITDLAGNALVPPAPWSWSLPVWQRMGEPLNVDPNIAAEHPAIALHDGAPIVVWLETNSDSKPPADVYVRRWDGSAWTRLGPALNDDEARTGPMYGHPDIAVSEDGTPVVAWPQPIANLGYVERWDGAAWRALGGAFNADPDEPTRQVSLALDEEGRPWIAWQEGSGAEGLHVARWTGSAWDPVGEPRDRTGHDVTGFPSLVFDAEGRAVVGWSQEADAAGDTTGGYVDRWTGSSWEPLGGGLAANEAFSPYLRLAGTGDGRLYASVVDERSADRSVLVVRRWDEEAGAWASVGQMASPDGGLVGYGTLAIGTDERPVAAWMEQVDTGDGFLNRFHVEAWDGFEFRSVGIPIEAGFEPFLDLAVGPSGVPILAGSVPGEDPGPYRLRVWRHNVLP